MFLSTFFEKGRGILGQSYDLLVATSERPIAFWDSKGSPLGRSPQRAKFPCVLP